MEIKPKPTPVPGPPDWFTGEVSLEVLIRPSEPSRTSVAAVHFAPGARTAWHSHSTGQTLYVTDGEGRVQARGHDALTIRSGDVVWTPADEWHWHGAAPDHAMTHLSITDGEPTWGEHVTDEEYQSDR